MKNSLTEIKSIIVKTNTTHVKQPRCWLAQDTAHERFASGHIPNPSRQTWRRGRPQKRSARKAHSIMTTIDSETSLNFGPARVNQFVSWGSRYLRRNLPSNWPIARRVTYMCWSRWPAIPRCRHVSSSWTTSTIRWCWSCPAGTCSWNERKRKWGV